ncbi:unnamed protein product [Paramecium octaurelia]|uniref:MORN repeat protein n=1 Tax=Paramecium octaurelia TaxID=43137 RepID=A0A8S1VMV0_PAROT|nr:unnamed protein product [Paramecium octaurelia]
MSFCLDHSDNPIIFICTAQHKCQRKLCNECVIEHGVSTRWAVPINTFSKSLQKILSAYKQNDNQDQLAQIRILFQTLYSENKKIMKEMWDDFKNSMNSIYNRIEEQDQCYVKLLNEDINLENLSQVEMDNLVSIQQGELLDDWNLQKSDYIKKLNKAKELLEKEMKFISNKLKFEIKEIQNMFKIEKKESYLWEEGTKTYTGIYWVYDEPTSQRSTKLQVNFTQNQEMQYFRDGSMIRTDKIQDTKRKPKILINLEQIQYLQWHGKYGHNNQKVGKWIATWKGEQLQGVGGEYSDDGEKQGLWRDMIKNYWSQAQILEEGVYIGGLRNGIWKYIYENKEIGGGDYNKQGLRNGKWIQLSEGFWNQSQVKYIGRYKNGDKVGRWDICKFGGIQIGGGLYDEIGNGMKLGPWVEISENYAWESQVIYQGGYKNGQKVGSWKIWYIKDAENKQKEIIGGGLYDEEGDGLKLGDWVEIADNFCSKSQITYKGRYRNSKKAGRWDIWYKDMRTQNDKKIGGGLYDEENEGIKFGYWEEISDYFGWESKVTYKGEYKNGKKVGRWDIWYKKDYEDQQNEKIGGGLYDEENQGFKIGNWTEILDNFSWESKVTYNGEYNLGEKVGKWDIWFKYKGKNQQIGGGFYDEAGNGFKQGNWIEIFDNFWDYSQTTYSGRYQNGKKVGRWDIWLNYASKKEKIGGGNYDEQGYGVKLGNWEEISNNSNFSSLLVFKGDYTNGQKVGVWVEMQRDLNNMIEEFKKVKEIKYNN